MPRTTTPYRRHNQPRLRHIRHGRHTHHNVDGTAERGDRRTTTTHRTTFHRRGAEENKKRCEYAICIEAWTCTCSDVAPTRQPRRQLRRRWLCHSLLADPRQEIRRRRQPPRTTMPNATTTSLPSRAAISTMTGRTPMRITNDGIVAAPLLPLAATTHIAPNSHNTQHQTSHGDDGHQATHPHREQHRLQHQQQPDARTTPTTPIISHHTETTLITTTETTNDDETHGPAQRSAVRTHAPKTSNTHWVEARADATRRLGGLHPLLARHTTPGQDSGGHHGILADTDAARHERDMTTAKRRKVTAGILV